MIQKVIYVMSLNFSGSTILSLMLSKLESAYFIGEPALIYRKDNNGFKHKEFCTPCKMKSMHHQCSVWGDEQIEKFRGSRDNFFEILSTRIPHGYDTLIDSSKDLQWISKNINPSVKSSVIHITKPLHSWIASMKGRSKLKYPVEFYTMQWIASNKEIMEFAEEKNLPYMHINYEEFANDYKRIEKQVCDFTGKNINCDYDMWSGLMHFVKGNPDVGESLRPDTGKSKKISLDEKWRTVLTESELQRMYSIHDAREAMIRLGYQVPVTVQCSAITEIKNKLLYKNAYQIFRFKNLV